MKKGSFIGINFGTTNTAVVHLQSDDHGTRIVNLGEGGGDYPFSSVVAVPKSGGALKFGREVKDHREELSAEYEIFTSMKSFLGTNKEFKVGSNRYSATDITTQFLKSVKDYIARVHKVDINEAGLAFPIDFSPEARRELRIAAENAGIMVKCFVSESTAAYLSNREKVRAFSRIMVLDWGGGTFDISILDLKKNSVTEVSVFGERVGGDDIDIELARRVHADIVKRTADTSPIPFDDMSPTDHDLMVAHCERAKIEISETNEDYDLTVMDYGVYGTKTVPIRVDYFDELVKPIINNRILRSIDKALGRANMTPAGIDAVIIIGGSSNLSAYERAITNLFGLDKIFLTDKPQWSTAIGAAMMRIIGGNFKLSDTLGVLLSDDFIFPLFEASRDGVGSEIAPIDFSMVEDAQNANFIFVNRDDEGMSNITYDRVAIPTKGFLNERIRLSGKIGDDQIARIEIANSFMGHSVNISSRHVEINKLTFFYNLADLNQGGRDEE